MKALFLLFGLVFGLVIQAQQKDSLQEFKAHDPSRAAKLSIMLPGAGQVYNSLAMPKGKKHAWWKVPLIYGGLAFTGYQIYDNHILQRDLRKEYEFRMDNGMPNPDFPEFQIYDQQGVLTLYQQHKASRDLMIFGFLAVYGLNVLDALVEAHFVDFDVSNDLSLRVMPYMNQRRETGINLTFKFK